MLLEPKIKKRKKKKEKRKSSFVLWRRPTDAALFLGRTLHGTHLGILVYSEDLKPSM
jgi:hypothetical protein